VMFAIGLRWGCCTSKRSNETIQWCVWPMANAEKCEKASPEWQGEKCDNCSLNSGIHIHSLHDMCTAVQDVYYTQTPLGFNRIKHADTPAQKNNL
jgi:hypothetical protein